MGVCSPPFAASFEDQSFFLSLDHEVSHRGVYNHVGQLKLHSTLSALWAAG